MSSPLARILSRYNAAARRACMARARDDKSLLARTQYWFEAWGRAALAAAQIQQPLPFPSQRACRFLTAEGVIGVPHV